MSKCQFMTIGVPKGGTAYIHFYLRNHPEIGMSDRLELHFFDREKLFESPGPHDDVYHKHFDFNSGKKIYGETTPIYMYWTKALPRIKAYNPDMKLIALLRNPTERAFTDWSFEKEKNREDKDFTRCLHRDINFINKFPDKQRKKHSYVDRGLYSGQIERLRSMFPDEQLLFIKYEDFIDNQLAHLHTIFDFLGVSKDGYEFKEFKMPQNLSLETINTAERATLLNYYARDIKQVEKLLNWDCRDWLAH